MKREALHSYLENGGIALLFGDANYNPPESFAELLALATALLSTLTPTCKVA